MIFCNLNKMTKMNLIQMVLNKMRIKDWIVLLINAFIFLTVAVLTFFFYQEFKSALNERVLLQLSSVQRLKREQIESLLIDQWKSFESRKPESRNTKRDNVLKSHFLPDFDFELLYNLPEGIHDFSHVDKDGGLLLVFIKGNQEGFNYIEVNRMPKVQKILAERTGMGYSGETYIVGENFYMRSKSRFYPDKRLSDIEVKTEGVLEALKGNSGADIFQDYRGKDVYSVYFPLKHPFFYWVVLSEIDVKEVREPLLRMKHKLVFLAFSLIIIVAVVSYFLINKITAPIQKASDLLKEMATGGYEVEVHPEDFSLEIRQLYESLLALQKSLLGAIEFSNQLGTMNLQARYTPSGDDDTLGKSLLVMREKLDEFQQTTIRNLLLSKQLLIKGQEDERKRLSKELHDGLGPLLTTLKLMIQSIEIDTSQKDELKIFLNEVIQEVRRISNDLMPSSLVDFGVAQAVNHWISFLQKSSTIRLEFINEMLEDDVAKYDKQIDIGLYRIIQELVNNGLRHSLAQNIKISLTEFEDKICLFYFDDGVGFDEFSTYKGAGLRNCKERAEILGGYFYVNSKKGTTIIEVEIPLI